MATGTLEGVIVRVCFILTVSINCNRGGEVPNATVRVNQLSEQITAVIEHFKSADPVGLPMVPIPDPMPILEDLPLGSMTMINQSVYGLSKFRIESISSNLEDMEVYTLLSIDKIIVLGNYTVKSWFSRGEGASNATMTGLILEGNTKLEVDREGNIEAVGVDLDITVTDIDINMENRGLLLSIMQGAMNKAGTLLFDAMKPFIMDLINGIIIGEVNKTLKGLKITFPNSLSPVDFCFAEGRKLARKMGYDPLKVNDFTHTTGILGIYVTHIQVRGLASFYRVGNITAIVENNTVYIGVSAGTQQLEGQCNWEVTIGGLMSTGGKMAFSIEYLKVETKVNQSLDVRNKPNLEDIDITLGNFQFQFDGAGTLDYVIEAGVNILPNLLRDQIMIAVEEPLKIILQEIFNDIDVEQTIKDQVEQLNNLKGNIESGVQVTEKYTHEEGLTIDESRLDEGIF